MFLDYDLPPELVAQEPAEPRDSSRLLVLRRDSGAISHHTFRELPDLLDPRDVVVFNDTRVVAARLIGTRAKTGGKWEGLFLREANGLWEMLAQTRGWVEVGEVVAVGDLRLTLRDRTSDRHWLMQPDSDEPAEVLLSRFGEMPLPPYIRKGRANPDDAARYQTVYADRPGAVAAPTAGLHFTPELLAKLPYRGTVTLHVGLGTFEPMRADPASHVMHREWCEVPQATVDAIQACRERDGRVVAVGTTAVRSLESSQGLPFVGETDLYIREPYTFRCVDAMVTNFHLPKTTLLLLVGAMAGAEHLRTAYETAIRERYRFYSYGDAMLVL